MSDATEMTLPEALAEIERLRARVLHFEALAATYAELAVAERTRADTLEAARAVTLGTLEAPPESTADWTIEHNVPGNAPV